jgi:putative tricarboxylic transport membrane protein
LDIYFANRTKTQISKEGVIVKSKHLAVLTVIVALLVVSVFTISGCSTASEKAKYPTKPIEFVVHSGAGGTPDLFVRTISDILTKHKIINVPISVTNKPGGGGTVSFKYVAGKAGDPYVLLGTPSVFTTQAVINPKESPGYKEFTPIGLLAIEPICIVVKGDSPYKTLADLVAAGKTKPQGITWALTSIGSYDHVMGMRIADTTKAKIVYLPNSSDGEAVVQVLSGNADCVSINPRPILGQVKAGALRILSVSTAQRVNGVDAPTLKEAGVDIATGGPRGVVAPKDIPAEAKAILVSDLKKMVETEQWKKYLQDTYAVPANLFDADFIKYLKEESERVEPVFKAAGLIKK